MDIMMLIDREDRAGRGENAFRLPTSVSSKTDAETQEKQFIHQEVACSDNNLAPGSLLALG